MAKLVPIAWHDLVEMLRKFGFDVHILVGNIRI